MVWTEGCESCWATQAAGPIPPPTRPPASPPTHPKVYEYVCVCIYILLPTPVCPVEVLVKEEINVYLFIRVQQPVIPWWNGAWGQPGQGWRAGGWMDVMQRRGGRLGEGAECLLVRVQQPVGPWWNGA